MRIRTLAAVTFALFVGTTLASAASKDDAVAMVKKTVAVIKTDGAEKAYAAINTPGSAYQNGEVYVVVLGADGTTLAHPVNPKLIGKNMMEVQDVDGKFFTKDMVTRSKTEASFWYDFKFVNPATKKIQVKDMYCEALPPTTICAGVYRP